MCRPLNTLPFAAASATAASYKRHIQIDMRQRLEPPSAVYHANSRQGGSPPPGLRRGWGKEGEARDWRGARGHYYRWPGRGVKELTRGEHRIFSFFFSFLAAREHERVVNLPHHLRTLQRRSRGASRAAHRSCERGSRDERFSRIWRTLG